MAIRAIGATGNEPAIDRDAGGAEEPEGSILDLEQPTTFDGDGADNSSQPTGGSSSANGYVDPASIPGADANAPFGRFPDGRPRKRAPNGSRSAGGRNTGKPGRPAKPNSKTAGDLAGILCGIHSMLAMMTKIDELEIDEEESRELVEAGMRVAELYEVPLPSEKVLAWVGLSKAVANVYGTRVGALMIKKKRRGKQPQVVSMPNAMGL